MRIWIFSSGLENLSFLNLLKQYNVDIFLYINQHARPIEDKTFDFQQEYIDQGIDSLLKKNVDKIILPPVWELKYVEKDFVFPLFQNILAQSLKYSLMGKIWIIWNELDSVFLTEYLENLDYKKTDIQKKTKNFQTFKLHRKNVAWWSYNLNFLSKRDRMLRKIIKTDLRCMFDASVDTIVPSTYAVYHFERLISQKIKKIRFQSTWTWWFLDEMLGPRWNNYSIDLEKIWNTDLFFSNKKRSIMLK